MARRPRQPNQAATRARRTPTPAAPPSDEEVEDAPDTQAATPQEEEEQEAGTPADTPAGTPAARSDAADDASNRSTPPTVQPFPGRRRGRLGRPPRNRPADWDTPEPQNRDGSEAGTPTKRKRGRPALGGWRGRPRGGPSHVTRVPIDKEGNTLEVIEDEVALPEDPEGETKVDKLGNLQGGRDYRVRVFTILGREKRLYMLSTEPARCTGFRDSYLFFTKHLQLFKIIIDDAEKRDLIDREIIPHSYKGRAIGVVTARSVFREFGARIIIGGRKVVDDYYAQAARDRGDVEGALADPYDKLPGPGEKYNKNQYVAWHGASSVYHTGQPSVPMPNGKPVAGKRKINITSANWQFEHAREASRFNSTLVAMRRRNIDGYYDAHTNAMLYPGITQPTHARWVHGGESSTSASATSNGLTNGEPKELNGVNEHSAIEHRSSHTIFAPVAATVARNYAVIDIHYVSPPFSGLGIPGPDGDYVDVGPSGLPDLSPQNLSLLPSECQIAFEHAKEKEAEWKHQWATETHDGMRAKLKVGYSGYPL